MKQAYRDLQGAGSDQCPDAERLAALAVGEISAPARERLADHVIGCRRCSESLQILARTHGEARQSPGLRPRRVWIAAAAVALVAIAAAFLIPRTAAPRPEVLRGTRRASEAAVVPGPGSRLDAPPRGFSWIAPAGASNNNSRVRLFDASGVRVWESEPLAEPKASLPESVRAALADGSYFWTVEVETTGGAEKLGPFPFDLARR